MTDTKETEIQRWDVEHSGWDGWSLEKFIEGDLVKYEDHLAARKADQDEIVRLTESNLYLRTETVKDHVQMMKAAEVIRELKASLRRYGEHKCPCYMREDSEDECCCGFTQALKTSEAKR